MSNTTILVSIATDGTQGDSWSENPTISANGLYVAFESEAQNLAAGGDNGLKDIFVRNLNNNGETKLVSIPPSGTLWNNDSFNPVLSGDGRYVAFENRSRTINGYGVHDIYVHDQINGNTKLVSVSFNGTPAKGTSWRPAISADGRYVAFASDADDIVLGDTNNSRDVFVQDLSTGETKLVSIASDGTQGDGYSGGCEVCGPDPSRGGLAISADGRYIAFESEAKNLVPGDENQATDIFVHDQIEGKTTRVSSAFDGTEANRESFAPDISDDGRYVAFQSLADNLVLEDRNRNSDIFVYDRSTEQTIRASVASDGTESNGYSNKPSISGDGRFVAFRSEADNLVLGDRNNNSDVFVHDLWTRQTSLVSLGNDGSQGNDNSPQPIGGAIGISGDGGFVVFDSDADNLVLVDTNFNTDIFVRERDLISTISINDVAINEGNSGTTTFNFTVTLSPGSTQTVTVDYATADQTATTADSDYTAANGTLTFAPGETSKTISVPVIGDTKDEPDEIFQVNLINSTNVSLADTQGVGTIYNDDVTNITLNTRTYRFQNLSRPGTYLFVGEAERQNILRNFPSFQEEGFAFNVAVEPGDSLLAFYRFQNASVPGTYLYAGSAERESIKANFPNFVEEGLAFYAYGVEASQGSPFYRFQNTEVLGTYLFVGQQERQNILENFPSFVEEGVAFRAGI